MVFKPLKMELVSSEFFLGIVNTFFDALKIFIRFYNGLIFVASIWVFTTMFRPFTKTEPAEFPATFAHHMEASLVLVDWTFAPWTDFTVGFNPL